MAYVSIPKDLASVKSKVLFNLTKRQLICFSLGAAVGIPSFFLLRGSTGNSTASLVMIAVMIPFFMFALYEKNGQPLECILRDIIKVYFKRPGFRAYEIKNYYSVIERQSELDKEVKRIVRRNKANKER